MQANDHPIVRPVIGLGAGIAIGVPSALAAVLAAGGGHGTYGAAAVLFPYTMLATRYLGSVTAPLIVLALIQYPAYGLAAAWIGRRLGTWRVIGGVFILHVLFALAAFMAATPVSIPR